MESDAGTYTVTIDAGSAQHIDCLYCLKGFDGAVDELRAADSAPDTLDSMIAQTKEAFVNLDKAEEDAVFLATRATDNFYRIVSQLTVMDDFTRGYIALVIRNFYHQLHLRNLTTYYILDNALREDRFRAICELFPLAGVKVVSAHLRGTDWSTLSEMIKSCVGNGSHVAYVEPDALVNHIEPAIQLGKQLGCVSTFRNSTPEDPIFDVISIPQTGSP